MVDDDAPDHCTIQIDRRTLPGENDGAVQREILRFLRSRGLRATMADTKGDAHAPCFEIPETVKGPFEISYTKKAWGRHPGWTASAKAL